MDREFANSELSTEFRPLEVPSTRPRQYYDISMFRDDADAEFNSVEIPPALAGSQSFTNSQINIEEQYSRDPSFSMGYRPLYSESAFGRTGETSRTSATTKSAYHRTPNSSNALNIPDGLNEPYERFWNGHNLFNEPTNRFKHHSQINEPRTPVRVAQKHVRHSSSSDEFGLESSPTRSAMPPPSRQGTISYGIHKSSRNLPASSQHAPLPPSHQGTTGYGFNKSGGNLPVLPQYAPLRPPPVASPRENPLNTLLKKTNHPALKQLPPIEDIEETPTPTQHEQNYSPRQVLSLSHAPTMAQGIQLIPISSLPKKYHTIFPYKLFNATQSKCFNAVFNSSANIVLSSPTGSGKTVVMELAICRLMETFEPGTFKIIYQAPTKALCAERKRDWEKKFAALGLKCTELTGDTQFNQLAEVKNGDLIVTTPEKWDSVTRRWADHKKLLGLVRLFLIDEVHILKEDRGATLEVVVSRMKTIGSRVRFVALSATVPNSKDIATWLGKDCDNPSVPAHEERLGEEFRPVKLEKVVYGYQANSNDFVFDKFLDQKLYEVIQKHSQRKPVMVFCATRNICVSTAKVLAEKWSSTSGRERHWPAPLTNFSLRDRDLQLTGKSGVAFHHAGLEITDRTLIEKLFLEGHLSVICCTSTLAVGVNLPTHLVVIKNTVSWQGCQMREYLDLEVMQMVGRAGRPQFDTTGVAVIMTRKDKKDKYERMISGTEKLESCLHLNLIEHLNAEIGLGTITDIESAKQWLRSTFLYIRMKSNPAYYNFKVENIESEVESIMERDIDSLSEAGFVEWQQTKLKCLEPGDAMARYYIKFRTMKNIMELKEKAKVSEILEGLGIVGVRKFVNNDIKTIDQLDALEAHKIEMIASRNPPYGAKIKQDIAGIPRFRLYTQVTKVQANRKDPVKINFRAEIGVLNEQTPARWHGKLLHLYFLVERSDGYLVDFRRMPILKLASNKDVMVQAELTEPGQSINCYIACEEIGNVAKFENGWRNDDSQFPPTKKEGPMSAFLKKRATMVAQNQEVIDLTERRGSIVNKPFKPPGRERNRASKDEIDEFEDEEFEKELLELDAISGNLGADTNTKRTTTSQPPMGGQQKPKPVPSPSWTPINNRESQSFSINHGSEDDLQPPPEEEDPEELNEPKQRLDDLSKDDDSPSSSFKGNGADSVRRLNELHAKCQKSKSIKIPRPSNLSSYYSSAEKPQVPQKRSAISDELEALLEDDEDFPTISELMEEVRMKDGSISKGKGKETVEDLEEGLYGLKDGLLDSLDVYAVDTPEKDSKMEDKKDERSVFDIPEHTPPKEDMRKRPKMTAPQSSGTDGKAVHEISSETLPSSPPPSSMKRAQESLVPSGPAKPAKRVRFDDEVLQDIQTIPSSKQNCNPVFITTSESNSEAGNERRGIGDKMNNSEIPMPPPNERNEEGFNEVEQEIMDFLGDCVVFV
ncbi:Sec63 [Orbilia oligospora]|nr:Sec63 [Orbilia oligospora]